MLKGNAIMQNKIQATTNHHATPNLLSAGGLPVRTNLRAGSTWDDIGDQTKALWGKLTNAVSSSTPSAASTASTTPTPSA